MAPGPAEEAGKALGTIAETMRSQPLAFGMLIVNLLWIAFFVWFAMNLRDRNTIERAYLVKQIEKCEAGKEP